MLVVLREDRGTSLKSKVTYLLTFLLISSSIQLGLVTPTVRSESPTIRILPDGSISPITAPIQRDGDSYLLTANITYPDYLGVAIEASNIKLDGDGFTIVGPRKPRDR